MKKKSFGDENKNKSVKSSYSKLFFCDTNNTIGDNTIGRSLEGLNKFPILTLVVLEHIILTSSNET